jgi:hypothetical protein
MKKWLVLASICISSIAHAGPFGLEMGMSLAELNKIIKLKQEQPFTYSATSLPNGHPDLTDYRLVITPEHGLCKVIGFTDGFTTNSYGQQAKDRFEKFEDALISKYGVGKKYDMLRSGSIWREPRDWMMGLMKEERVLSTLWSSKGNTKLPDNLKSINLEAFATSSDRSMIMVGYEFASVSDCLKSIEKKKNSSL